MLEIGAGGGSIAEIDEFGLLRIGPHSAGSRPGPACYDRGGNEPTVTDACLVLGFLNPEYFLGGEMALNADAAASAIEAKIARPLGMDVVGAAEAIHRVVIENMTEAARVHAVEMNVDLRGRSLIAFGGAGPIHAYGVAERLGVSRVVCPPQAGVLSALGLLAAPLSFEFAKTQTAELQDLDSKTVNQILESLETLGTRLLRRAGVSEIAFERSVDMCYSGQGYEVTTPIEAERFRTDQTKELGVAFENVYEETYGRRLTGLDARCITWRVLASGPRPELHFASLASSATPRSASPKTTRRAVFADTGSVPCAVYERSALGVGSTFNGPALIEDRASTIVIPPLLRASVDSHGNVIFTPTPSIGELETAKTRRAHRSRNRCECS
jgi:N-methylhydantoinase A